MKKVYTLDSTYDTFAHSIFLAGPTHRIVDNKPTPRSWRDHALRILDIYQYDGNVFIPEYADGKLPQDWTLEQQVAWECETMKHANIIIFWIPRNMETLPALTTNIEFGEWFKSGKVIVGGPFNAVKNEYLIERCRRIDLNWYYLLEDIIDKAMVIKESWR